VVQAAFSNVQSLITSGNTTGLSAAYQSLQDAIKAAEQIAAINGVK
jgi:ribosomal protein S18